MEFVRRIGAAFLEASHANRGRYATVLGKYSGKGRYGWSVAECIDGMPVGGDGACME